ncbi:serine/threonine-protein kinase N2-like [Xenopus laevis]|uniref:Serine/threonine-protein kinase N2-like n=1 Tax=Xenopus laevis TaxID=8355 RepID=A0A8J1M0X5_XENLA|nr:serine/threonine-protein kinase N2-like [Xenopus laevis]
MLRPSTGLVVPTFLAADAVNLISGLLQRDPLKRLGSSEEDACDVMHHYFFRSIDWMALLERRMQPPFIPEDVRLSEDKDQHLVLTPPSEGSLAMEKEIAEAFRDFDYTAM